MSQRVVFQRDVNVEKRVEAFENWLESWEIEKKNVKENYKRDLNELLNFYKYIQASTSTIQKYEEKSNEIKKRFDGKVQQISVKNVISFKKK